jgi:site-specific recombinase XerC
MKLTQLIAQYVAFRKSLGQDFESDGRRLRTFSRFVGESAEIDSVKPPQVAAFLAGRGPITRYWHLKYGTLRGFFSYALTRGYLSTSPLPATVPKPPARFVPHIYSREELCRLLDGTASTKAFAGSSFGLSRTGVFRSAGTALSTVHGEFLKLAITVSERTVVAVYGTTE